MQKPANIHYRFDSPKDLAHLTELYHSVEWRNYTGAPEKLAQAVENSSYTICAYDNDKLVGLVRGLSDKISVHYIQDLLVHPDYQNQGIGSTLLEKAVNLYSESRKHVLLNVLLTDEEPSVMEFYESQGFQNTKKDTKRKINAFIRWGPETY